MRVSRTLRIILASIVAVILAAAIVVGLTWPRIHAWAIGRHQRSVTKSLAEWGREYATITNDASAVAAAGVVGYMSTYYVPGPGYHGPMDVETALEAQRRASIARVAEALERYTGLAYGTNVQRWKEWAEDQKKKLSNATQL